MMFHRPNHACILLQAMNQVAYSRNSYNVAIMLADEIKLCSQVCIARSCYYLYVISNKVSLIGIKGSANTVLLSVTV